MRFIGQYGKPCKVHLIKNWKTIKKSTLNRVRIYSVFLFIRAVLQEEPEKA